MQNYIFIMKTVLLFYVLKNVSLNLKHLPLTESIEVAGLKMGGLDTQKPPILGYFFAVLSGTAHELMVSA